MNTKYITLRNSLFLFIFFLLLGACSSGNPTANQENKPTSVEASPTPKMMKKPETYYTDTLVINSESAIFFNPDTIQVEKYKTMASHNEFESMKHDCFFQQRNARMVLKKDWPKISIIENYNSRYLIFVKADKKTTVLDLDTKGDLCGIILFNKKKEPQLIDMMSIENELEYYFKH